MVLEGGPKRYYIFCVVQPTRRSQVKLLSAISAVSGKSSNPYFFACLLKICNRPEIALPIRSSCELPHVRSASQAICTHVAFVELQSMRR